VFSVLWTLLNNNIILVVKLQYVQTVILNLPKSI